MDSGTRRNMPERTPAGTMTNRRLVFKSTRDQCPVWADEAGHAGHIWRGTIWHIEPLAPGYQLGHISASSGAASSQLLFAQSFADPMPGLGDRQWCIWRPTIPITEPAVVEE